MTERTEFGRELKLLTARAASWSVLRVGWSSVSTFVIFSLLTRMLDLRHVGLFALAMSLVEVVRILAGAGLGDALLRQATLDDKTLDTAFWGGLLLSGLVALATLAVAPAYAWAMNAPELTSVVWVLAALVPISALDRVHLNLKLREFGHKQVALRAVLASTIGGASALVSAYLGAGVWALVIQSAVTDVVGVVLAWRMYPWIPRLRFDWRRLRPLLSFGGGMVLTQLMWTILVRVPDLFIGRTLGPAAVGVYRVGWRLVELIGQSLMAPLSNVSLITFSRLQDDSRALENAYCRLVGLGSLVVIPMVIGVGLVAHDVVPLLFGERWRASADIAMILALSAPPFVTNYFFSPVLAAKAKSYQISQIAAVQLVSTAALAYLAAPYGLAAVAGAYVLRGYLTLPLIQYNLARHAGIRISRALSSVVPAVAAAAAMAVVVLSVQAIHIENVILRVGLHVSVGVLAYVACLLIFARKTVLSHWETLKPILNRPQE